MHVVPSGDLTLSSGIGSHSVLKLCIFCCAVSCFSNPLHLFFPLSLLPAGAAAVCVFFIAVKLRRDALPPQKPRVVAALQALRGETFISKSDFACFNVRFAEVASVVLHYAKRGTDINISYCLPHALRSVAWGHVLNPRRSSEWTEKHNFFF